MGGEEGPPAAQVADLSGCRLMLVIAPQRQRHVRQHLPERRAPHRFRALRISASKAADSSWSGVVYRMPHPCAAASFSFSCSLSNAAPRECRPRINSPPCFSSASPPPCTAGHAQSNRHRRGGLKRYSGIGRGKPDNSQSRSKASPLARGISGGALFVRLRFRLRFALILFALSPLAVVAVPPVIDVAVAHRTGPPLSVRYPRSTACAIGHLPHQLVRDRKSTRLNSSH